MKTAAPPLAVAFNVACGIAYAQSTSDPMETLRTCSAMEGQARLECLQDVSRKNPPSSRSSRDTAWIVSETTSPVDYLPVVTATATSVGSSDGAAMQLAIHCRRGRTEVIVAGPALSRSANEYVISFRLNADTPMQLAAASPSFGSGVAFGGDVVKLLSSLPDDGHIVVSLFTRTGPVQGGQFLLSGFENVRKKMAAACKWPHAVARPGR
ncbi:hypothetical protein GA0061098_102419 [Bradyrhizobium shewense]|uniref:Type VI secretion system protein VasI n=1 Tax=Bradyrhizobium shewense TaxID=1761772 RepID=A0A1C3XPN6_9BRAD|nr:hypothetical protein [Bradyrhizobium shewense]SCB54189.1 hypothetical protein GA0061098_102419 [Bradyrhizobium shewense]